MPLVLHNSYSKREEEFKPLTSGKVTMYTCGPTVYGRPHIGNYSSFLMADLLRRWLEVSGYSVTHVKNITDVGHLVADADQGEDKIEAQAKAEKVDPLAIARKYTDQYLADEKLLNMIEPEHRPRATETIPDMIAIIEKLLATEHAYETEDGVYFSVETFPQYGALSGNTLDKLDAGARITVDENKRHPADFALWKKTVGANAHHSLRWSSPWGDGFPGWHIECSAMSSKFLETPIDIHTGGEDNIFPHHECEIAQSECSGADPFVRYWVHKRRIEIVAKEDGQDSENRGAGILPASAASHHSVADSKQVSAGEEGVKMSKSLGNVLSIDDILARGFSAMDLRYLLLSVHYRTRLKFSWKGMEDSKKARHKIMQWMEEMDAKPAGGSPDSGKATLAYADAFTAAMNADLNTSGALAAVFDAMAWTRNQEHLSEKELAAVHAFITTIRRTFGCFDPETLSIPADVQALIDEREAARRRKDFKESDRLRGEIQRRGFVVEDSAKGVRVTKN